MLAGIAFNLTRATATFTRPQLARATTGTIRGTLIAVPARIACPTRHRPNGDAGGAAADPDWQAGVAKGAMLDVRCWMGYRWSKKVRTSALKRAGCSMFEA